MKELFRKIHEKLILIFCDTIGSRKYSERKDKYSMIKVKVLIISNMCSKLKISILSSLMSSRCRRGRNPRKTCL